MAYTSSHPTSADIQGAIWTVNKHDETTINYFIDEENVDV